MVDENTSHVSVLGTISRSGGSRGKKTSWTAHTLTPVFTELLSFIRYFPTFGQQISVDLYIYVTRKPQPSPK